MTAAGPIRLLLGPQRPARNLREAIAAAGVPEGPLAVISAGWQEAEGDLDDVAEVVGRPLHELGLYGRAEQIFAAETGFAAAYRKRQDRLREQQQLYRQRLRQLAIAARETLRASGEPELLSAEQRHAIAQLRALDRHHLHRTEVLHERFEAEHPLGGGVLAEHAAAIGETIRNASAVLITGGNVVVLLNRLRLFGIASALRDANIVGWSAGAMVLAPRVVLFHDRTPEGRRDAEVLGAGLGLVPGHVVLPDGRRRLRHRDRMRMTLLSRRFGPDTCAVLDSGAALAVDAGGVILASGAKRLNREGRLVRIRTA